MCLVYFLWIGIFILLTVVYLKKEDKRIDSYAVSSEIKGISILAVILGHLSRVAGIKNSFFNLLGAQGVTLFLILSGYGLYKSYNTKGINIQYWKKRILTVLVPYSIVTAVFILIDLSFFHKSYSLSYILKNLLGINSLNRFDGTMWYIQFILSWYIIFGIIFYFKNLKDIRIVILFVFSIIFYRKMNTQPFSMYLYQCAVHAFWFPLGVLLARLDKPLLSIIKNNVKLIINSLIFISIAAIIFSQINFNDNLYILYNLSVSVVIANIILILSNLKVFSRFLNYIGSISFYLYLFEGLFLFNYTIISPTKPLISFVIYFFIIFFLSILYKFLIKSFKNKIAT